tara:strand:+ start:18173 stop:19357 length:1185 start_codon:yes stop_codon:yes gene_type:complete
MNFLVAYRLLFSQYNLSFISIISKVSIIGLMLGVGILITVLSVMNGFEKELRDKILGFTSHITIHANNELSTDKLISIIESDKNIASYSFVSRNEELISSSSSKNIPIIIHNVSPEKENQTSDIGRMIIQGSFEFNGSNDLVIGNVLARELGVTSGDVIEISNYNKLQKNNKFIISGIFDSGLYEYNQRFVYASNLSLTNNSEYTYIKIKLFDPLRASLVSRNLFDKFGIITSNWTETHNALFQAISNEKRVMFIILALIIAIASFNIISSLTLLVLNKQKDIAILLSLGISRRSIQYIFLIQGFIIGILGILFGVILGLILAININQIVIFLESIFNITFISPEIYHLSKVPYIILMSDICNIVLISLVMVLLTSIYPAAKASKITPARSLNS